MLDLYLTPGGSLLLEKSPDSAATILPELFERTARKTFDQNPSEGLLALAIMRHEAALPPVWSYWKRLGERYLTELCHVPEPSENFAVPLPPPCSDLERLATEAPPMRGGEYLHAEVLERIWVELDTYARQQITVCPGGFSEWLKQRSPLWHRVGRVCFHLAENKRDAEFPFAFLATYAPSLIEGRRVQYQPLGRALEEYSGANNKQALIHLLTPIQKASEQCAWVKELTESGDVFRPLRWTPDDALRILRDVPLLEESGLLVHVPDWWSKRPARVRVGVNIGGLKQSGFGANAMLDFNVEMTLDGERLTEEEWQSILNASQGLVWLKGKWTEVDRDKLARTLEHWKQVEREAQDGVSFIDGMRLLAGARIDATGAGLLDEEDSAWAEIRASRWLEDKLREIRQPDVLAIALPGAELKATLRPYQETGVRWLRALSRVGLGACLADDMGLGKTVQVLALLLLIKRENKSQPPALLVLPASLLANWKSEIEKFAPTLVAKFVHPSQVDAAEMRRAAQDPHAFIANTDVVITTYSMLLRQEWLTGIDWSLVALDEAQAIKNPAARQTRAAKKLKAQTRLVLTGTPVENRLGDLWSIFDFISPGLLGSAKAFSDFVKHLNERESDQFAPLRKLVSPFILRRLKTDKTVISDLPNKTEVQAFCNLSRKQAVLYQQSVKELEQALEGKDGIERRGVVLAFILRFKQICNHPSQWMGSGEYAPDDSGKFRRLRELCEEISQRQEKVLIFSQFREMTEPLAGFLRDVFGRPGLILHGGVAVKARKKIVDDFQREDGPPYFVLSLKAGGTGLNLTAASHVIHFDRWWNPAVENQATDRAFRIGQKKNVMVHKFVCQGTVEEKIDAMIRDKTKLAGEILEAGATQLITEMSDKDLLDLVRLNVTAIEED